MLISNQDLPNPAPTLLEDLVSRTGSPNSHSLSPYDGMLKVLLTQFPHYKYNLERVLNMLRSWPDYNADRQKPVAGMWVKERPDPDTYLRKLEDIDPSWVQKYLENALTGVKLNRSGGVREYNEQHRVAKSFSNAEGEEAEECELLLERQPRPPMDVAEAKAKLPYLLKRLYDKSIQMRVSIMSLIIAYERIKRRSGTLPKPRDLLYVGVYKMTPDGHLGGLFPDSANNSRPFPAAVSWIRGIDRDAYFQDMLELLQACEVLGVDICEEDPHDYQAENIAKLKISYISKNREYLSGARHRNLNVLNSLQSVRIADYQIALGGAIPESVRIENTMHLILDSENASLQECLSRPLPPSCINQFFALYSRFYPKFSVTRARREFMAFGRRSTSDQLIVPRLGDFYLREGFLCDPQDARKLQTFDTTPMVDFEKVPAGTAIAHASGYLFLITDDCHIYYQDMLELGNFLKDRLEGNMSHSYTNNHKYGWWSECYA